MVADEGSLKKHSVVIAGHQTSITLEPAFWIALKAIARRQKISVSRLVSDIDHSRVGNLSSAIRVFVLQDCQKRLL